MRPAAFQLAQEYIVLYKTDYKRNVGLVTCESCVYGDMAATCATSAPCAASRGCREALAAPTALAFTWGTCAWRGEVVIGLSARYKDVHLAGAGIRVAGFHLLRVLVSSRQNYQVTSHTTPLVPSREAPAQFSTGPCCQRPNPACQHGQ